MADPAISFRRYAASTNVLGAGDSVVVLKTLMSQWVYSSRSSNGLARASPTRPPKPP